MEKEAKVRHPASRRPSLGSEEKVSVSDLCRASAVYKVLLHRSGHAGEGLRPMVTRLAHNEGERGQDRVLSPQAAPVPFPP